MIVRYLLKVMLVLSAVAMAILAVGLLLLQMGALDLKIASASSSVWYVAPDGNCGSIPSCYASIQDAVDAASDGDTIKIAQGVFTASANAVVLINKAITLTGGYSIDNWNKSGTLSLPTIVDAGNVAGRRGVYVAGTSRGAATLAGLVIQQGAAPLGGGIYVLTGTVVLQDSLVISNTVTGDYPSGRGGGVYIVTGDVVLIRSSFRNNWAEQSGGGAYVLSGTVTLDDVDLRQNVARYGGGIFIEDGSVALNHSDIFTNAADGDIWPGYGGGVFVDGGVAVLSNNKVKGNLTSDGSGSGVYVDNGIVTLNGNSFLNNSKAWYGGGLNVHAGTVILSGNTFKEHYASFDGGAIYVDGGNITSQVNFFDRNSARNNGGAMYVSGGVIESRHNTFRNNWSELGGGAIYIFSGQVTISENTFQENSAFSYSGGGGGVQIDGGVVTVNRSQFISNTARHSGGGVYVSLFGSTDLNYNRFAGNTAGTRGGGLYVYAGTANLDGNFFFSNSAGDYGGGIGVGDAAVNAQNDVIAHNTPSGVYYDDNSFFAKELIARHWTLDNNGEYAVLAVEGVVSITNTIVSNHPAGFWGSPIAADHTLFFNNSIACGDGAICTNQLTGDPKFLDAGAWDYHIAADSPAIDKGVNVGVYQDNDGEPRPWIGYDLGADEVWPPNVKRVYLPLTIRE